MTKTVYRIYIILLLQIFYCKNSFAQKGKNIKIVFGECSLDTSKKQLDSIVVFVPNRQKRRVEICSNNEYKISLLFYVRVNSRKEIVKRRTDIWYDGYWHKDAFRTHIGQQIFIPIVPTRWRVDRSRYKYGYIPMTANPVNIYIPKKNDTLVIYPLNIYYHFRK